MFCCCQRVVSAFSTIKKIGLNLNKCVAQTVGPLDYVSLRCSVEF